MARASRCSLLVLAAFAAQPLRAEPAGPPPALLSRQLMEAEGLAVGDVVELSADPSGEGARPFRVVGRYEPMPDPMLITATRHEARLHLADLLELEGSPAHDDAVTQINVLLAEGADVDRVVEDLARRLPSLIVLPAGRVDEASNPFVVLERFHLAISLITVVGSTAFLLALMVMRADERRETVGILRLIGFSRGRVLLEVFVEGLLVAVGGALFGIALAWALQDAFNRFFQWHYDTPLVFVRVTGAIAWRCIAAAVPLGVLAGLVTSWTLLRRRVLELLGR